MIAGFGLTLAAAAEPPPPTFIDRELHASYTVPVGWEQIPQKYVDLVSQEAIRATGQPGIHYLAAYQPKGLQWLTGPYILVSHIVTGGPSLDELRQLMETGTQQMERKLNSGDSGSIESMEVGKPTVDRARQLIVIPLHATVTQVGPVLGVAAMKLGKLGALQVGFYSPQLLYGRDKPKFEASLDHIRFEEGYGYTADRDLAGKVRATLRGWFASEGDFVKVSRFVGGVLGALAMVFLLTRFRRR